jgi:hypothetical protein
MSGWWASATLEQRLAQIDGGIECGLAAREVAMICGIRVAHPAEMVAAFASRHGRKFPQKYRGGETMWRKAELRHAFWQGDRDLSDAAVARRGDVQPDYAEVTFE